MSTASARSSSVWSPRQWSGGSSVTCPGRSGPSTRWTTRWAWSIRTVSPACSAACWSACSRYPVADPRVRPVFEAAAAHPGTIVFVHCGVLTVGVRRKLGLPSLFDMRYSNPIDLHAVAMEFPRVNFVIPHFGAGYLREALMLCDLCPNVYLDTSSSNSWIRYQPESLDLKSVFRKALEVAGPRRLLFGTDSSFFPRGWHAQIFQ